jgi:hypothetical protein
LPLPLTLEELRLSGTKCNPWALVGLTTLTKLRISVGWDWDSLDPSEALASLTTLKRLDISCPAMLTPALAALTLLTHLALRCDDYGPIDLAPFTGLQGLAHLEIDGSPKIGPEHFNAIEQMTSLNSLALDCAELCVTTVPALSQLTALGLSCPEEAHVLAGIHLEGLEDLTLKDGYLLTDMELAALRRATGLTRLEFCFDYGYQGGSTGFGSMGAEIWRVTLSHMSRLQCLVLNPGPLGGESLFDAIGRCTSLTKLEWRGEDLATADVAQCARLTKLRVLRLLPEPSESEDDSRVDSFMPLAGLPELRILELNTEMDSAMICKVESKINRNRHRRGWPPLDLCLH